MFSQKKAFLIFFQKKASPIFRNETLALKIPYIFSKERLSCIFKNGTLQFSAEAWKIKEIYLGKIDCTLENGNPEETYIFSKKLNI